MDILGMINGMITSIDYPKLGRIRYLILQPYGWDELPSMVKHPLTFTKNHSLVTLRIHPMVGSSPVVARIKRWGPPKKT